MQFQLRQVTGNNFFNYITHCRRKSNLLTFNIHNFYFHHSHSRILKGFNNSIFYSMGLGIFESIGLRDEIMCVQPVYEYNIPLEIEDLWRRWLKMEWPFRPLLSSSAAIWFNKRRHKTEHKSFCYVFLLFLTLLYYYLSTLPCICLACRIGKLDFFLMKVSRANNNLFQYPKY